MRDEFPGAFWNGDGECVIVILGADNGEYRNAEPGDWCSPDLIDNPGMCE